MAHQGKKVDIFNFVNGEHPAWKIPHAHNALARRYGSGRPWSKATKAKMLLAYIRLVEAHVLTIREGLKEAGYVEE